MINKEELKLKRYILEQTEHLKRLDETCKELANLFQFLSRQISRKDESEVKIPVKKETVKKEDSLM